MQHGWKDRHMRSVRNGDDLSGEPSLGEVLADPIVRALMARDGVSEDELVQLSLAARTRLLRTREAVVMPFPGALRPAPGVATAEPERRPFQVPPADTKQAGMKKGT